MINRLLRNGSFEFQLPLIFWQTFYDILEVLLKRGVFATVPFNWLLPKPVVQHALD